MVQLGVPLAPGAGLQTGGLGSAHDLIPQRDVVACLYAHLGRAEGGHGARRAAAGGDVEIIPIQNGVGRCHNQYIRRPPGHLCRRLGHGAAGGGDFPLPALAHLGQQHRRVRSQDCTKHRHIGTLPSSVLR